MVKIVKCAVCRNNIKKQNANQFFVHCSVRQPITDDNWVNKPQPMEKKQQKSKSENHTNEPDKQAEGEKNEGQEPNTVVPNSSSNSHTNEESGQSNDSVVKEEISTAREQGDALAPASPEAENTVFEEEEPNVDISKYKYRCDGCNSYFNELQGEACPSCKREDVDVEVLKEEEEDNE